MKVVLTEASKGHPGCTGVHQEKGSPLWKTPSTFNWIIIILVNFGKLISGLFLGKILGISFGIALEQLRGPGLESNFREIIL